MAMTAEDVIELLGLRRHPEGGWYRQTFMDGHADGQRPHSTAIYYLLAEGERSHWHRIDATEVWHWYAGAPLALALSPDDHTRAKTIQLGNVLENGERPQVVVPAFHWQAAMTLGRWTLVGCTVAPGFDFGGFELAPPGWQPG